MHPVDALVCIISDRNMEENEVLLSSFIERTLVVDPRCHGHRELKHLSTCRKIYPGYSVSSGERNQIFGRCFGVLTLIVWKNK